MGTEKRSLASSEILMFLSAIAAVLTAASASVQPDIVMSPGRGIQKDWSYQVNGEAVFAGEPLSIVRDASKSESPLRDRPAELVDSLCSEGFSYVVWKDKLDPNFGGDSVSVDGIPYHKSLKFKAKWFPCSDFGVYRNRRWYASVRMQSSRTAGPDGRLVVRQKSGDSRSGRIYGGRNRTPHVHGLVYKKMMCTTMELKKNTVSGFKSYFFFPDAIVCLATELNPMEDSVIIEDTPLGDNVLHQSDSIWININGRTYVNLCSRFMQTEVTHQGNQRIFFRKAPDYAYAQLPCSGPRKARRFVKHPSVQVVGNDAASQAVYHKSYLIVAFHIPGKCSFGGKTFEIDRPSIVVFHHGKIVASSPIPQNL